MALDVVEHLILPLLRPQPAQIHQHHAGVDVGAALVHVQPQLVDPAEQLAHVGGRREQAVAHGRLVQRPHRAVDHHVRVEIQHALQRFGQILRRKDAIVHLRGIARRGGRFGKPSCVRADGEKRVLRAENRPGGGKGCVRNARMEQIDFEALAGIGMAQR